MELSSSQRILQGPIIFLAFVSTSILLRHGIEKKNQRDIDAVSVTAADGDIHLHISNNDNNSASSGSSTLYTDYIWKDMNNIHIYTNKAIILHDGSSKNSRDNMSKSNSVSNDLGNNTKSQINGTIPSYLKSLAAIGKVNSAAKLKSEDIHQELRNANISATGKIIKKFVITGGPCSGKTTAMAKLQEFLRERGFRVFVATEAATIFFLNGAQFDDMNHPHLQFAFQQFVIRTQLTLEDCLYNYAVQTNHDCVILCDRGLMDGSAYVDPETWNKVLKDVEMDTVSARDTRYDAVFHLVTCADGAPEYYTLSNNDARSEDLESAIQVDRKLEKAWAGHAHHVIIDNKDGKSFDTKLQELVLSISYYVGLPTLTKTSKKYILLEAPDISQLPNVQIFDCEKIIMDNDLFSSERISAASAHRRGKILYSFIRKRSQGSFNSCALTTVKQLDTGEEVELKQVISSRMYNMLSAYADKTRNTVIQRRYYFLYEQQSFHIYEYISPEPGLWTLQCQSQHGTPKFPPYLKVGKLISKNESFSSYFISRKDISRANSFVDSPTKRDSDMLYHP